MFESGKIKKAIKKLINGQTAEVSDSQIIDYLIDKKIAQDVLSEEDYDAFGEAYEAYKERTEKLEYGSFEDLAGRAAEIAYTLNDFVDVNEILSEKDASLREQVDLCLDDFKVWQKHIFSTFFSTAKSLVSLASRPEIEKNENFNEADMYAMTIPFFGMMIAIIENRYRENDPNGYLEFRDSVTREDMNDALYWRSFRAYEAKMSKLLDEKYKDAVDGTRNYKIDGMMKEYSIIMNGKVPTGTKLIKIGEAYLYNTGIKAPSEAMKDVIEGFIVFLKFYPLDELSIVDHDFKKLFGQYTHPVTKQPIASAQDYLDAVTSQATGTNVVTDKELSLEEIDKEYAEKYGSTSNPRTGKPISSAADFIDAYKCQRGL